MGTRVYVSRYKDREAVSVESSGLTAVFLPGLGGKFASFIHKKSGKEFFVQEGGASYKVLPYDGMYADAECSGFDDMFPTIDACYYETFPWAGMRLPDHGEVCGLPWAHEFRNDGVSLSVHGVRLPYLMRKSISFLDERTINIEYKLKNMSCFPMDYIYAAHPMLNTEEGGEIITPFDQGAKGICVFSSDESMGAYGDGISWPFIAGRGGSKKNGKLSPAFSPFGTTYKFYFSDPIPEGIFGYRYPDERLELRLDFSREELPYAGLWVNEGAFHGYSNVAIEPCSGAFDRIDAAKLRGMNSVLAPGSARRWHIRFSVYEY